MFCKKCGALLPESANVCPVCGESQGEGGIEPRWETCEIRYEELSRSGFWRPKVSFRFWAQATGPNGRYSAVTGTTVECSPNDYGHITNILPGRSPEQEQMANALLREIEEKLLKEGWVFHSNQMNDPNNILYNIYRRQVK